MTTRAASEIVIGPVITERTYLLYTQGRYTFRVAPTASKTDIKNALEEQYGSIKVRKVNTVSMRGKKRRAYRRFGSGAGTAPREKGARTARAGRQKKRQFGCGRCRVTK